MMQLFRWEQLRDCSELDRFSYFDLDEEEYKLLIFKDKTYAVIKFNEDSNDDEWDVVDEEFDIESMSFKTRYISPRLG